MTVEGVPNSGKTTVSLVIAKALEEYGFAVKGDLHFSECGDGSMFQELSDEDMKKRKEKLFHPTFRDSVTNKRTVFVRQRQIPRGGA